MVRQAHHERELDGLTTNGSWMGSPRTDLPAHVHFVPVRPEPFDRAQDRLVEG